MLSIIFGIEVISDASYYITIFSIVLNDTDIPVSHLLPEYPG